MAVCVGMYVQICVSLHISSRMTRTDTDTAMFDFAACKTAPLYLCFNCEKYILDIYQAVSLMCTKLAVLQRTDLNRYNITY